MAICDAEALRAAIIQQMNRGDVEATPIYQLVNDGHLACKWDALYGLEYATIRDMPEELLDLVKKIDPRLVSPQATGGAAQRSTHGSWKDKFDENLRNLTSYASTIEKWAKPYPEGGLTTSDILDDRIDQALHVAYQIPEGSLHARLALPPGWRNIYQLLPPELSDLVQKSLAIDDDKEEPCFHGVVINIVPEQVSKNANWDELHRITHVSLVSMVRHSHAFEIDLPVFGILLKGSEATIEIGWWEETEDGVFVLAAPVARETQENHESDDSDFLECRSPYPSHFVWNLASESGLQEFTTILINLDRYIRGPFAHSARVGLDDAVQSLKESAFVPWKWDGLVNDDLIAGNHEPIEWPGSEEAEMTQTEILIGTPTRLRISDFSGATSSSLSTGRYDGEITRENSLSISTPATSLRRSSIVAGKGGAPSLGSPVEIPSFGQSRLRQRLDED